MNIFKKFFKKDTPALSPMEQKVETVQAVIDETNESDEIAHQKAIQVALEQIRNDPDMNTGKFAKMLLENSSFTSSDIQTLVIEIVKKDKEKSALKIVQETPLSTSQIQKIVAKAPVSLDTAEEMIKEIPDEDIQRKEQEKIDSERRRKALEGISNLYKSCDNIESNTLSDKVKALNIQDSTPDIQEKLISLVTKRVALDCMKYGTCRYEPLFDIVPSSELFDANLPSLANAEYKRLKIKYDENHKKYFEFTPQRKVEIHKKLLEDIARNAARNFKAFNEFGLPKSEKLKTLNDEDVNFFIGIIKSDCPKVSKNAIKRLSRQLNGEAVASLRDLNRMLEKMNPKDRDIVVQNTITGIVNHSLFKGSPSQVPELDRTLLDIDIQIKNLPECEQLSTAKIIKDTVIGRQESLKLMKNIKKSTAPKTTHSAPSDHNNTAR